ncbi:MAG TPA: hypothetical protein PLQ76_00425 [bacterium]|nr:hypothetical protein [bacterium]
MKKHVAAAAAAAMIAMLATGCSQPKKPAAAGEKDRPAAVATKATASKAPAGRPAERTVKPPADKRVAEPRAAAPIDARTFTAPNGSFSIILPAGLPKMTKEAIPVGAKAPKNAAFYTATGGNIMFMVGLIDIDVPKSAVFNMDKSLQDGVSLLSRRSEVLSRKDTTLEGNPAVEVRIFRNDRANPSYGRNLIGFVNNTQITLQAVSQDMVVLDSPEVETFFRSFDYKSGKKK